MTTDTLIVLNHINECLCTLRAADSGFTRNVLCHKNAKENTGFFVFFILL